VKMPWYDGHTLLHILETVHVAADKNYVDFRFPVQNVIRPDLDFRGFAGSITSGTIRVGEEIAALPSGRTSRIKSIVTYDGNLKTAVTPQSVCITLEDEIDISRGDMIVRPHNVPRIENDIEATICWMSDSVMDPSKKYIIRHTTRQLRARIKELRYRIDVDTLHRDTSVEQLGLNELGRVLIRVQKPLYCDDYSINRSTGAFILIEEGTNQTVGAGMIMKKSEAPPEPEWEF